ncbi:60 kDa heat shock protein, CPN60 protein (nucleomorph) [Lotharella oceanica]|uniref:60 kDa heat shock protein, CPN60 protein n=1 Tax=Lotharella oceanica TaxID=641309 RepID=A0A060D7T0_9EUKA|nr:60 kDa heat shock protein, CPN60 protein [Lotharella oceanica]|mmetsp:Transcript_18583/g.35080  ORF Transcript_18583/g.35080 Transcript_18583/m.35080 type:complete len:548 (-) Transcript_18583:908-2551(-)
MKNSICKSRNIDQIKSGIHRTSKILSLTIGPRGKNIVIWNKIETPIILNDGTSIVNNLSNVNFNEHIGQYVIKEVVHNVNNSVGDGTSTTGILVGDLLQNGLSLINSGYRFQNMSEGLTKICYLLIQKINHIAWPLTKNDDILKIAINSTGGDVNLGNLLYQAFTKIGINGMINVETANSKYSSLVINAGFQFDRGYVSHKFINNFDTSSCEYDDCLVLVSDLELNTIDDAVMIMQAVMKAGKPLLLITEKIEKKPLITFINNYMKNKIQFVAVKIPSFGKYRKAVLQDISIATGAELLSKDKGNSFKQLQPSFFGSVKKCSVTRSSCTLIIKNKYKTSILRRIEFLENQLVENESTYETSFISERIAKMSGGVAIIQIGAHSDVELNDKLLRIEDAKNATFAALTKGVITGGATSFVHFSNLLQYYLMILQVIKEKIPLKLLINSLKKPAEHIIENSENNPYSIHRDLVTYPFEIGFDSNSNCITNLASEGVNDPSMLFFSSLNTLSKIAPVLLSVKMLLVKNKNIKLDITTTNKGVLKIPRLLNM